LTTPSAAREQLATIHGGATEADKLLARVNRFVTRSPELRLYFTIGSTG
jgi:hypothetical protein